MHTNDILTDTATVDGQQPPSQQRPAQPTGTPGWPNWAVQTLAWLTTKTAAGRRFVSTDPSGAATLIGTAVGALATAVLLLAALAKVLTWVIYGNPAHDITAAVPAVHIVTDPIEHWLALHTAGLPLSTHAAAWTWAVTGLVLLYSATFRHVGAQLLWPVYGIATAAMVWFGTDTAAHRPVAVGLVAIVWSALALLALRGRPSTSRPTPSDRA